MLTGSSKKKLTSDERRIQKYLLRRTITSQATAVTTTNIAAAVHLSNDEAWRTLDKMYEKSLVDRSPDKGRRRHFLLNGITRRRYYGRNMQRAFTQFAQELLRYAMQTPTILVILRCTIADIRSLVDVWTDLDRYNEYISILTNNGIITKLPKLLWRSEAISWWLQ
jgi:DNA-binding MarR family transcriptional regulator